MKMSDLIAYLNSRLISRIADQARRIPERTMEERLVQSERLATIGRFASQIAHEIRNPLSSISLNVKLLEDERKDTDHPGSQRRYLEYHF